MGDREYWQGYRDWLNSRVDLMRAGLKNRGEDLATRAPSSDAFLTHRNIREVRHVREAELHLAAVDRLLAGNGQLE